MRTRNAKYDIQHELDRVSPHPFVHLRSLDVSLSFQLLEIHDHRNSPSYSGKNSSNQAKDLQVAKIIHYPTMVAQLTHILEISLTAMYSFEV